MYRVITAWAVVAGWAMLIAPASAAESCDKSFAEAYREVAPSVVRVLAIAIDPFSLTERVRMGTGSGVVIDDAGHVVTNAHVVYDAADVVLSLESDEIRPARVVGFDPISDLAVVEPLDRSRRPPKATLGSAQGVEIGRQVLAVGHPFGLEKTATQGIVSGTGRVLPLSPMSWLTPMMQTDAAISPGNSGGPLVDLCGRVLGINTLSGRAGQNLNFAVPIDTVRELVPQLVAEGRVIRPWHGIHGRLVPPMLMYTLGIAPGFMVETVEPGSPAERIGLRGGRLPVAVGADRFLLGGDVITRVNGEPLEDMETVIRIVTAFEVGDRVALEYRRDGMTMTAEVVLPERPTLPGDMQRFRERRESRFEH
jgi:S1-C subfamily serine protease